ncbi:MAG: tetratricopeptide repeat protein [Spirochaetes bacterium]|nr:tetratricopeptide repeat protein [Spirochaetota bacterium]
MLAQSYTELGQVFSDNNQWDKAGEAWSRALELEPRQQLAAYNLIRAFTESGHYDKALAQAERLLEQDPENNLVLAAKAYALYRQGDAEAALALYSRVVENYSADINSSFNLAILLDMAGRKEESLALYVDLRKRAPDNLDIQYRYGVLILESGDAEAAIEPLERYRLAKAASIPVRTALYRAYEQLGRYDKVVELLLELVSKVPAESLYLFQLARIRLTAIEEGSQGLVDLQSALSAGFRDEDAFAALLADENLVEREAVDAAIREAREQDAAKELEAAADQQAAADGNDESDESDETASDETAAP